MYQRLPSWLRYAGIGAVVISGTQAYQEYKDAKELGAGCTLHLDLESCKVVEEKKAPTLLTSLSALGGGEQRKMSVAEVAEALKLAEGDRRVRGMYMTLPGSGAPITKGGFAAYQELRDCLLAFTKAKNAVVGSPSQQPVSSAWTTSFGEGGNGTASYYLATGCEKVFVQPSGMLGVVGLSSQTLFLREFLDKLNIVPTFITREQYKNAANTFTEKDYTRAHMQATKGYLSDLYNQIVQGVADARSMKPRTVAYYINRAPLNVENAVRAGLVDGGLYRDEFLTTILAGLLESPTGVPDDDGAVHQRPAEKSKSMAVARYLRIRRSEGQRDTLMKWARNGFKEPGAGCVQIVTMSGQIRAGTKSDDKYAQDTIWSKDSAALLRKLRKDKNTKAVVLRVNSPGGSALGSDEIRREVELLVSCGKPVVVSMGSLAASGGYMISAPASEIIASPGTLTGSIGVIYGKFNIENFLKAYGINAASVDFGDNASIESSTSPFTRRQYRQLDAFVDEIYRDFMEKVRKGRSLTAWQVRSVAKGRVWSGETAKQCGLVDGIGGMDVAVARAKELALAANPDIGDVGALRVTQYKENPFKKIFGAAGEEDGAPGALSMSDEIASSLISIGIDMLSSCMRTKASEAGMAASPQMLLPRPVEREGGNSNL